MSAPTAVPVETGTILTSLVKIKETKGAVQYQDPSGSGVVIPTLYIRKDAFLNGVFPEKIVVTVTCL